MLFSLDVSGVRTPQAMDICCDNYHLIDLLLPALKEEAADPVILAASCTGACTCYLFRLAFKLLPFVSLLPLINTSPVRFCLLLLAWLSGCRRSSFMRVAALMHALGGGGAADSGASVCYLL